MQVHEEMKKKTNPLSLSILLSSLFNLVVFSHVNKKPFIKKSNFNKKQVKKNTLPKHEEEEEEEFTSPFKGTLAISSTFLYDQVPKILDRYFS